LFEYHYKVSFHATDEEEAGFIRNYFGDVPAVFTAGNFPNKISFLPVQPKEKGRLKLVTIGIISPMKNILLVLESLAGVTGHIDYTIYGPVKDEEYWESCKAVIKSLPENINVAYEKEIEPQKIPAALEQAHVFILPSKSENFGHAIFEALSAGRPVITSDHTPWKNLKESKAGVNVPVGSGGGLAEAIDFFTNMDQAELETWSRESFNYSERAVDVEKIREEYGAMFS
jgi:glycosyltransferase involved in cell wall biosynthesis